MPLAGSVAASVSTPGVEAATPGRVRCVVFHPSCVPWSWVKATAELDGLAPEATAGRLLQQGRKFRNEEIERALSCSPPTCRQGNERSVLTSSGRRTTGGGSEPLMFHSHGAPSRRTSGNPGTPCLRSRPVSPNSHTDASRYAAAGARPVSAPSNRCWSSPPVRREARRGLSYQAAIR